MRKLKVISVVGARPNFVKIAPFLRQLKKYKDVASILVHTGQHYTDYMSDYFLKDFRIFRYVRLGVSHTSPEKQMAEIRKKFEKVLLKEMPDIVVVVGDVNSTRACALAASGLGVKVAHIEAGLRSFDNTMPEERNRIITDSVSDLLFTTEPSGRRNLLREGIPGRKIFFVGNIMIDSLVQHIKEFRRRDVPRKLGLDKKRYAVLTLHRPSNVDNKTRLKKVVDMLCRAQHIIKIVYPVHPRAIKMLKRFGYWKRLLRQPDIMLIKPLGYIDFMSLISEAKFVMTDSGGMQEETTYLRIPCFTLRKNTERPITVTKGTNRIIGNDYIRLMRLIKRVSRRRKKRRPELWDGKTAARIWRVLEMDVKTRSF